MQLLLYKLLTNKFLQHKELVGFLIAYHYVCVVVIECVLYQLTCLMHNQIEQAFFLIYVVKK